MEFLACIHHQNTYVAADNGGLVNKRCMVNRIVELRQLAREATARAKTGQALVSALRLPRS